MTECVYFKQRNQEICLKQMAEALQVWESDIVFIAGSLVESLKNKNSAGMGNRLSDIDVFVVREEKQFEGQADGEDGYNYKNMKVEFRDFQGIPVDVEYYARDSILSMVSQLNAIDFAGCDINKRLKNWITVPDGMYLNNFLSFLHRLYYSIPICNTQLYDRLYHSVSYENYFKYMGLFYIESMDTRYEDVLGSLECAEYAVAVEGCREMLRNAMMAYAFSVRESIDRLKWLPLRMKNIAACDKVSGQIYSQYIKYMFETPLAVPEDYRKNAENIINLTEYIAARVRKNLAL